MPAPKNPYRDAYEEMATPLHDLAMPMPAERDRPRMETPGFGSTDVEHIAQRNYHLGRRHAWSESEAEMQRLRAQLRQRPAAAYDEGYDAGTDEAEREALDQIIALLGPARVMADELQGRPGRRRLTAKQHESTTAELAGYVIAITNVLHSLEPLVFDTDRTTVNDARTPQGIKALREFVAKHGAPPFPFST